MKRLSSPVQMRSHLAAHSAPLRNKITNFLLILTQEIYCKKYLMKLTMFSIKTYSMNIDATDNYPSEI